MTTNDTNGSKSLSTIDLLDYDSAVGKGRKKKPARKRGVMHASSENAERYDPSPDVGLTAEQVAKRTEEGYLNITTKGGGKSYLRIIVSNVCTYLNLVVLVVFIMMALVVDFAADWSKFLFVVIILVNTVIGIIQEVKAKMAIDKLKLVTAPSAIVVRGGEVKAVSVQDVVLDDVILLETGKQICADSVLLTGECDVNESMLTGESVPIHKKAGDTLYSGSFVTSGSCRARVGKIGDENYVETLASYAKKYKKTKSELNRSVNLIIKVVSIVMIPIAILMFIRTYNFYWADLGAGRTVGELWARGSGNLFYEVITKVSGAVIGMIPSGMFLLTSVALAASMLRLVKRRAMVKNMYSIEMLARVDVLCLDKTGTITDGSMSVKRVIEIKGGEGNIPAADIIGSMLSATEDNNQTAIALADKFGYNLKFRPVTVLPFSSDRKLSAVTFEDIGTYLLGAPEFVLGEMGVRIKRLVDENASQGYRVMCLAHSPTEIKNNRLPAVRRPICLIVIEDHIREDAADTIKWFKENDVAVKVISGDNPITVSEVARRVGVADADKYISLEGLSNQEVFEAANRYTVFGRVTPEQKSILVRSIKAKGHNVAMTGDGVNDILAMRQADCAISIASGAEAARNVAHLVLMDNNFTSMPDVVVEGRRVINNIAKASSLYLMKTIMTVLLSVITLIIGQAYFFTTEQTLMYELFITAVPSLFLALQVNKDRVHGGFLGNMLKNASPGGLTLTIAVMAIYVYWRLAYPNSNVDDDQVFKTMVTIALTYTGYMVLLRLSRPYNAYRVILVVVTLACCLLGTFVLNGLFGVVYRTSSGVMLISLQDGLYISTVVLASYGVVSVLGSAISRINISAEPVEVTAAREEAERLEEERILSEYRERKANVVLDASEPAPRAAEQNARTSDAQPQTRTAQRAPAKASRQPAETSDKKDPKSGK